MMVSVFALGLFYCRVIRHWRSFKIISRVCVANKSFGKSFWNSWKAVPPFTKLFKIVLQMSLKQMHLNHKSLTKWFDRDVSFSFRIGFGLLSSYLLLSFGNIEKVCFDNKPSHKSFQNSQKAFAPFTKLLKIVLWTF
jgi:hypothetical protein